MKTTIKRLLDPRQRTKQNNTSNNVKEIEMKTRIISKKAILGLAIGTGLIAGFSVLLTGSETRAFNPAEATADLITQGTTSLSVQDFSPRRFSVQETHPRVSSNGDES